ncbi:MAG: ketol-acid reductoisomerase [Candidatus Melainabacteria bacterium]|nr:MAG: ketol-acid reductoisomerase [Candidatus Melainabacteria bacterium]
MEKLYWQNDASDEALRGKKVVVVGYGSQGRAHAMNLRDSGVDVAVALRPGGPTWAQAEQDGWKPIDYRTGMAGADLVAMLTPDMAQPSVYREIEPQLKKGATLLFAHGFNVQYKQIEPRADFDVVMIAPKGPGALVRRQYEEGSGVPCLLAVHQDTSGKGFDTALAYAHALGGTRAGVIQTTFSEETETDLFGEQAVLCGGVTELIAAGWETLVEAGYQPSVAYFECLHELKLIVDLIYEGGFARMHEFVSETAKYGDLTRGPRVVDDHVREKMKTILQEIRTGAFGAEWVQENASGRPNYKRLLDKDLNHPIEKVGKELRANMAWLKAQRKPANPNRQFAAVGERK